MGRFGKKSSFTSRKSSKSMFYKPPKHPTIAEKISIESPTKARESVKILIAEAEKAKRKDAILLRARASLLASMRAKAMLKRRNLSKKERRELKEVSEIYYRASKRLFKMYKEA